MAKFDIFDLTKHFEDEEKRFTFLMGFLDTLYTNTKEDCKNKVTKALVAQIIELFSREDSKFRSDPRLLRAWDLLGRTSNSLGYDAVMQKLDDLGYFKTSPEFYRLWATYLAEKKDRVNFEKLYARVTTCFPRNKSLLDIFASYAKQFGPKSVNQDEDVTENVFDKLGSTPIYRAPLPPSLAVLNEENERTSSSRSESDKSISSRNDSQKSILSRNESPKSISSRNESQKAISSRNESQKSVSSRNESQKSILSRNDSQNIAKKAAMASFVPVVSDPPPSKVPAANYSFTTHLHRDAVCAFGETLPLSQEVHEQQLPASVSKTVISMIAEKDFSVFAEQEEEEQMDQTPLSPLPSRVFSNPIIRDSPVMKKARCRRDSDDELEPSYDNPFGDIGSFNKPQLPSRHVFDSDKIFDDPTISGLNKHQSESRASSTPTNGRNGKSTVPTFEVSPTATFPLANKENEPFTFAPAVSGKDETKTPPPKRSTVPLLSEAINRMSIAPVDDDDDDLNATTHDLSIMPEVEIKSGINPWSENERSKVLKIAPPMVEQHDFLATKAPSFNTKGASIELGGEKFKIVRFIAQGGFARIYKTQAEDGKNYAIKLEMPSCPWEVYICKSLSVRLPQEIQPFVMSIRDAYIFSNASAIVYDYYPMKTLLDLSNSYKQENTTIDGMLVAFVGIQIAEILNYVHQAKIVHADIKPDNFVIVEQMSAELPHLQYIKPFVKLIDWGRAIDMSFYPGQTFKGRAGTNGFDCHEMQEERPWTYQTDFFGYVGTMHVLIFGLYMKTYYNPSRNVYCFTESLKRRYPLCETWTNIFRDFLNIPSCDKMPSWETVVTQLKQDLEDFATEDVCAWRRAIEKCNAVLRHSIN